MDWYNKYEFPMNHSKYNRGRCVREYPNPDELEGAHTNEKLLAVDRDTEA